MSEDTQAPKPRVQTALVITCGNLDIELVDGQLSLFSHELMKRISCDAKQTKKILDTLTQLRDMVEKAAAVQERVESKPQAQRTIEQRIDDLFR